MTSLLDKLSYAFLIPASLLLGLSPFVPKPHLVEKLQMLVNGRLTRPLDQFDLVWHALPILLLILKCLADLYKRKR